MMEPIGISASPIEGLFRRDRRCRLSIRGGVLTGRQVGQDNFSCDVVALRLNAFRLWENSEEGTVRLTLFWAGGQEILTIAVDGRCGIYGATLSDWLASGMSEVSP
jgi:hypothetical protein